MPPSAAAAEPFESVGVTLGDGDAVALLLVGALGVGGLLVFVVAEGDTLGVGELSVGVGEDRRLLGVGLADAVVVEVPDAVSRLVPR